MKHKTNLLAAFAMAFCFAGIPNLGGCDKNGDVSTNPATKPVEEHHVEVKHADGTVDTKDSKTVKHDDGTVESKTEEKKTSTP